uniref:Uncharacterized protein n=1 Tax=Romanomermis culicivorax TaxID=13658 RepID=A0A915KSI6_ROMCU
MAKACPKLPGDRKIGGGNTLGGLVYMETYHDSKSAAGINRLTVEPRKMWPCLQFEKENTSWGNGGLGGDVTLTGAFWQLDRATIAR